MVLIPSAMKLIWQKLWRDLKCFLGFHDYDHTDICQHCYHHRKFDDEHP